MNPVLILSYNGLPLLQECVESVKNQDIPTHIMALDNGSSDGSREWIIDNEDLSGFSPVLEKNIGVSAGWNYGLRIIFNTWNADYALVLNQDVVLPRSFYRDLLNRQELFVTGYPTDNRDTLISEHFVWIVPHPCFSAFLITRECWNKIGEFSDDLWSWCNDCDYHIRGHRLGIGMYKVGVPFFHVGSSTINSAPPKERRMMELQADADRQTFYEKWGAMPGTPEYSNLFK